jgi:hypothetical protein
LAAWRRFEAAHQELVLVVDAAGRAHGVDVVFDEAARGLRMPSRIAAIFNELAAPVKSGAFGSTSARRAIA